MTDSMRQNRLAAPLTALAGVVLCVAQALGYAEALCVTDGCALHENTTVFGLSLWWWGAGAFGSFAACDPTPTAFGRGNRRSV